MIAACSFEADRVVHSLIDVDAILPFRWALGSQSVTEKAHLHV